MRATSVMCNLEIIIFTYFVKTRIYDYAMVEKLIKIRQFIANDILVQKLSFLVKGI